jgi:TP901 family phage tail tape measure protein
MPSLRVPFSLEATPAMGMIDKLVGGMKKLTGSIGKTGVVAIAAGVGIGIFASKYIAKATQEAIKFQTEMIGLRKILGERQAFGIGEAIGDLSKEMPLARQELVKVAETAARLGIRGSSNILSFTRTMAMMGVATNISAEEAADALARVAKQTGLPVAKLENLGSVINELSNTMATSASEIVAAVRRSAPELARLGVPAEDIAALAATLNTVSESATRAGTRLRRLAQALSDPNKIKVFASALGKTTGEIRRMREEDPTKLILEIVNAMAEGGAAAERLASGLDARVRLALAALAQVQGDLNIALAMGKDEMEKNSSLFLEYSRILNTVVSKQQLFTNRITETRRELGENLLPAMSMWLDFLNTIAERINFIVNRPLEGIIEDDTLDRLEEASNRLKRNAENLKELQALASMKGDLGFDEFIDEKTAKKFRLEIELLTESVGVFGADFARAAVDIVERNADMGKSLEETRADVHGLSLSYVQFDAVAEGNVKMTVAIDRALNDLRADLRDGKIDVTEYAHQLDLLQMSLGWAKSKSYEFIEAEKALKQSLPTAEMVDFNAELEDEIFALTASEAQMLRLTPAYLEAVEAIETFKDTGKGNIEAIKNWKEGVDKLIDKLVGLKLAQKDADEAAKEAKRIVEQHNRDREQKINLINRHKIALELERVELMFGARAAYRKRLELEGLEKATVDLRVAEWDRNEVLRRQKAEEEAAASAAKSRDERIKRRMDLFDLGNVETRFRLLERVIDGMTDSVMEFFDAIVTGSGNAGQAFVNMIKSIVEEIIRAQIMKFFLNLLGPDGWDIFKIGGGGGGQDLNLTGLDLPRFASGGKLNRGQLAMVGEKGPELFVPNVGGKIVPNNKLDGVGGREPIVVNHNFTINAIDSQGVREMLSKERDFITGLSIDTIQRHRALKR